MLADILSSLATTLDSPADRANQIFCESPYHYIRHIRCTFNDDRVLTLAGAVPSFYLKQLAQIAVRHLDGVERISNRIDVLPEERPMAQG